MVGVAGHTPVPYATTRDVGAGATPAMDAEELGGALATSLLAGDVAAGYDAARRAAVGDGRGSAPDVVARRVAGAAQRAVGAAVPARRRSSPTSARRRSCATSTWPGLPDAARGRRAPCASSASSPTRPTPPPLDVAAERAAGRAGRRRGRRAGRVDARLAGAGDAAAAARGAARRLVPRAALRRPRRLHAGRRGRAVPRVRHRRRARAHRARQRRAGQPARRPGVAAARRAQRVRRRAHDADRPVRRRRHDARAARCAGGGGDAVRDQRRRGDPVRRGAVHEPRSVGRRRSTPRCRRRARRSTSSRARSSGRRRCCSWATPTSSCGGGRRCRCPPASRCAPPPSPTTAVPAAVARARPALRRALRRRRSSCSVAAVGVVGVRPDDARTRHHARPRLQPPTSGRARRLLPPPSRPRRRAGSSGPPPATAAGAAVRRPDRSAGTIDAAGEEDADHASTSSPASSCTCTADRVRSAGRLPRCSRRAARSTAAPPYVCQDLGRRRPSTSPGPGPSSSSRTPAGPGPTPLELAPIRPDRSARAARIGQPVTGEILDRGEIHRYRFDGAAGDPVYVASSRAAGPCTRGRPPAVHRRRRRGGRRAVRLRGHPAPGAPHDRRLRARRLQLGGWRRDLLGHPRAHPAGRHRARSSSARPSPVRSPCPARRSATSSGRRPATCCCSTGSARRRPGVAYTLHGPDGNQVGPNPYADGELHRRRAGDGHVHARRGQLAGRPRRLHHRGHAVLTRPLAVAGPVSSTGRRRSARGWRRRGRCHRARAGPTASTAPSSPTAGGTRRRCAGTASGAWP